MNIRFEYAATCEADVSAPDAARRFSATRLEAGLRELEAAGFEALARHLR